MSPEVDQKFDPPGPDWIWRKVWKAIVKRVNRLLGIKETLQAPKEPETKPDEKTQFNTGRLDWRREQQKKENSHEKQS